MQKKPGRRCLRCWAPLRLVRGARSRLCPFCGAYILVREQRIAVKPIDLAADDLFHQYQRGQLSAALAEIERLGKVTADHFRLSFYHACILLEQKQTKEAIYLLVELSGRDAPVHLRADVHAKFSEALIQVDRVQDAEKEAIRALNLYHGHPAGLFALARALFFSQRSNEALTTANLTLAQLQKQHWVTFVPQVQDVKLLMARAMVAMQQYEEAIATLEDIVLNERTADVACFRKVALDLAQVYLTQPSGASAALALLKEAAHLDPDNQFGMIDMFAQATRKAGEEFFSQQALFEQNRRERFRAIQKATSSLCGQLREDQIRPEMKLVLLDSDPDRRVALLERVAHRLNRTGFVCGTLYPLFNLEDFQRRVAAWIILEHIGHSSVRFP